MFNVIVSAVKTEQARHRLSQNFVELIKNAHTNISEKIIDVDPPKDAANLFGEIKERAGDFGDDENIFGIVFNAVIVGQVEFAVKFVDRNILGASGQVNHKSLDAEAGDLRAKLVAIIGGITAGAARTKHINFRVRINKHNDSP